MRVVGGGGPLDHIGENLEQTFNSEKRLGDLEIDSNRFPTVWAQTWVMGQVLDLWSPPGASCPGHECGSRLRERGGGPLTSGWVEPPLPGVHFPAGCPARCR